MLLPENQIDDSWIASASKAPTILAGLMTHRLEGQIEAEDCIPRDASHSMRELRHTCLSGRLS